MVLDSSPHFPSSTSLLQLCPSDATFPRECSCCSWIWRAPRKACSDLSLPPSLTHISPGPGREGKHQASVSYQFRGAGTRGFPTGLSLALHWEVSAFQGWSLSPPFQPLWSWAKGLPTSAKLESSSACPGRGCFLPAFCSLSWEGMAGSVTLQGFTLNTKK